MKKIGGVALRECHCVEEVGNLKIKTEIDLLVYSVVGKTDKHKKWGFKTQCMGDFKTFWDWTILN